MAKVKFDPNAKFETVASTKVKFDPTAEFDTVEEPSKLESFARGAAQTASLGFADEATGALESLFTDKTYDKARDESRANYKAAEHANPKTYMAGELGGAVASAFIPGMGVLNAGKGATLAAAAGKGALQGGLTGLGSSEADSAGGMLKDTAVGAGIGGALGGAINGAGKLLSKTGEIASDTAGSEGVKATGRAFLDEMKKPGDTLQNTVDTVATTMGIPAPIRVAKATKAAFDQAKGIQAAKREFGSIGDESQLMEHLLSAGDDQSSKAHRLVAEKFAAAHGGDPEAYVKLLQRSPEDLAAAGKFNHIEAGASLAPSVDKTFQDVKKAAGSQYEKLKDAARSQFEAQTTEPVRVVSEAMKEAKSFKSVSGNVHAVLDDVFTGLTGRGEGDLNFTQLNPAEQFDRLLEAKQRLGKAVKWASKNELPEGQQILSNTYAKFSKTLQQLDDMAAADKGYSGFKTLEKNLFQKLGNVERGRITGFDPIKMEKLFSGSASGRQLMKQVQTAREMLESGSLPEASANSVRGLLDKIDDMAKTATTKREMGAFRYGDAGPSSPAIQRVAAAAGKDSATTTAVRAPQLFLKMKAAAADTAQKIYGAPYSSLSREQKTQVGKYALWISQNDGASTEQIQQKLLELTKGGK